MTWPGEPDRVRFRFAPSPTGDLHLGNARTALLAWLQARSAGGRFILRMEDLDRGRVRLEHYEQQLADLRWMGIDWDEGPDIGGPAGPYLQSERSHRYREALEVLSRSGRLYACRCSRREILAAASAPHADDEGPAYPGTCRSRSDSDSDEAVALRFRVQDREVVVSDLVYGRRAFVPARETGDFVVRRKDGVAAYQLAVVVDDAAMGITHVLRGADLLSSTARQILLYEALGLEPPRWAHVPLLLDAAGDRLAKRHESLTLRYLRERGCPPERLVGWLAHTCRLLPESNAAYPGDLVADFGLHRLPTEDTRIAIPRWMERFGVTAD